MTRSHRSRTTVCSDSECDPSQSPNTLLPAATRSPALLGNSDLTTPIPAFTTNIRKRVRSILNTSQLKKKARVDTTDATDNDSSDDHHLTIDEVNERIHRESLKLFISWHVY